MIKALGYEDVFVVPQYSEIEHRKNVDISMEVVMGIVLKVPIISSPMDTVTEHGMAIAMSENGGLGIIHRYLNICNQVFEVKLSKSLGQLVAAAIGVTGDFFERAQELIAAGVDILCIDVAHGHHLLVKQALNRLKTRYSIPIIVGNVATEDGALFLADNGADAIRVGIGTGSVCSTWSVSGCGVPIITSLLQINEAFHRLGYNVPLIADGGVRCSGDIVKAVIAGASCVLIGRLFAECKESSFEYYGSSFKSVYRGMASLGAQVSRDKVSVVEGTEVLINKSTSVKKVINDLTDGIRSGCSYSGVNKLSMLKGRGLFLEK